VSWRQLNCWRREPPAVVSCRMSTGTQKLGGLFPLPTSSDLVLVPNPTHSPTTRSVIEASWQDRRLLLINLLRTSNLHFLLSDGYSSKITTHEGVQVSLPAFSFHKHPQTARQKMPKYSSRPISDIYTKCWETLILDDWKWVTGPFSLLIFNCEMNPVKINSE